MDYSNDNEKFLNELQQNNVTMRYFTLTNNILKLSYQSLIDPKYVIITLIKGFIK